MKKIKLFLLHTLVLLLLSAGYQEAEWAVQSKHILSKFAADVNPENVLPEYPRPQMVREPWLNLNGLWDLAIIPESQPRADDFDRKILVPFPVESALSGIADSVGPDQRVCYNKTFIVPEDWRDKKILLHFGAVDWQTTVWINGQEAGSHTGGYDAFTFDISGFLTDNDMQTLTVSVWDPTDKRNIEQPRGKQVSKPGGIWYTAVTGIWQTVWLEAVEKKHGYVESIKLVPDIDTQVLRVSAKIADRTENHHLKITARMESRTVALYEGEWQPQMVLHIKDATLWTPDNPFLYDLDIELFYDNESVDKIASYFGMRKISIAKDEKGITRMMLNNEFVFQFGPLDQGWWPDGLYTAATDEALRYDIEVTKKLGFNMARKHVKIEAERWYYWCDKLGLLVWQDMPSAGEYIGPDDPDAVRSKQSAEQYELELLQMIEERGNHPSIIVWVPFNEGWGQFDTERITDLIKKTDPSRLVNPTSGWADRGVGHIHDIHAYPGPNMPEPEQKRAIVLGEFGGLGLPVEGHTWQNKDNWGYRSYQNAQQLTAAYVALLRELQGMVSKGLSAAVYTQTTDVEVEVNGLMTYDRSVVKMDAGALNKINRGYLPPVIEAENDIFLESLTFELANALQQGRIYYTLDGSDPGKEDIRYERPVKLTQSALVKARSYWPDSTSSAVSQKIFSKVEMLPAVNASAEPGIAFDYYEQGMEDISKLPDFSSLESKTSGVTDVINMDKAERDDFFAMQFNGFIRVPADGIYTFYSDSDDGSQLFIHEQQVVDNDFTHGMTEKKGAIALAKGLHPIRLTFFQGRGGKGLRASIKSPGLEKQIIPGHMLFH